jgi:UDPglucose--hexose-1-phosphate uridylyltransferase
MSELRKDPVVGRWVIIATERGKRPSDFKAQSVLPESGLCPFCEGQEAKTPPEVFSFRKPHSHPNGPGWDIRVIPNKFPVLRVEGEMEKMGIGMYDKMSGIGAHEVIIETPNHNQQMEDLPVETIAKIFETYKLRLEDLMKDSRFRYLLVFKNVGQSAGATLEHSHSQLIATPVTPKRVKEELVGAQEYHQYKDRCVFCDMIREEIGQKSRMVYENDGFVSFCPFASRFPFEIWVLPKRHHPDFHNTQPHEMALLADCMKVTLEKLAKALNHPQYNYILHTGPIRGA